MNKFILKQLLTSLLLEINPKTKQGSGKKNKRLFTTVSSYDDRKNNIIEYSKGCTYIFDY